MDFVMNFCVVIILFGAIVMMLGMLWAMVDSRLWNNPGESVVFWGLGICGVGFFFMLVALFCSVLHCILSTSCSL